MLFIIIQTYFPLEDYYAVIPASLPLEVTKPPFGSDSALIQRSDCRQYIGFNYFVTLNSIKSVFCCEANGETSSGECDRFDDPKLEY